MTAEAASPLWARSPRRRWKNAYGVDILLSLLRHPVGGIGLAICLLLFLGAVFAPLLAPHDPAAQFSGHRLEGPSRDFIFGTDEYSRDLFSRLLFGLRASLLIGFGAVILGGGVGTFVGLFTGYIG